MNMYALSHLADQILLRDLATLVARDRTTTAQLLAHLAEVEERRLYLPAAHPSMHSYCVHVLRLSEQAALKRIRAARTARKFPAIFAAVAEGRLHLTGVILLTPHLTQETVDELLAAVTHKSQGAIEHYLAQRFPRQDLPTRVEPLSPPATTTLLTEPLGPQTAEQLSARTVEAPIPRPKVAALAPQRFSLQLTIRQDMHDKLRYAQELLSHQLPSGDVVEVIDRALDALIVKLEKTKFAATDRPRPGRPRAKASARYVPAHVKRAVRERDGHQCTFVSESGKRCPARKFLEFDHIDEVARGGEATTERMRLRCRAHNQYEAERTFGTTFMDRKRDEARRAAAEKRVAAERAAAAEREAAERAAAAERAKELDVIPCLRQLGFRAEEARLAAKQCETIPDAPLEERVRTALRFLGSRGRPYDSRQAARSPGAATGFVAP